MNTSSGISKGDVFEDKDPRSPGRKLVVVGFCTKKRVISRDGAWVEETVECALLENLAERHCLSPRRVKIRLDEVAKRFCKIGENGRVGLR